MSTAIQANLTPKMPESVLDLLRELDSTNRPLPPQDGERPLLLDAYHRVSRKGDRSGPSYLSPDLQKAKTRRAIESVKGVLHRNILDENLSGGDLTKRPKLLASIERIRRGDIDGIVVPRINRLSRNLEDLVKVARIIKEAGGRLISAEENIELTTPQGMMHLQFVGMLAENELELTKESWRDIHKRNVGDGVANGKVPFGYVKRREAHWLTLDERAHPHPGQYVKDMRIVGGRRVDDGTVEPGRPTHEWLTEMYRRKANRHTHREIADWLNEHNVRTTGGKLWTNTAVEKTLKVKGHLGVVIYSSKKGNFYAGKDDAHEALVDFETWMAAQTVRARRPRRPNHEVAPLAGLLRCANCRYLMPACNTAGKPVHYACSTRQRGGGRCPHGAGIYNHIIWPYVQELFLRWFEAQREEYRAVKATNAEFEKAQAEVDELDAERQQLVENFSELVKLWGGMPTYKMKAAENQSRLKAARTRLSLISMKLRGSEPMEFDLAARWDTLTNTEKRGYVAEAFAAIFVDTAGEKVDGRRVGGHRPVTDRVRVLSHEALDALPGGIPLQGNTGYEIARVPRELFGR